jgi:hypothetical protein
MFEYTKMILTKVSFDSWLFSRELRKASRWLKREEALLLYTWCMATFGSHYKEIISEVFKNIAG